MQEVKCADGANDSPPLSKQHLSNENCIEDKRQDYQNSSVLYCVRLFRTLSTHIHRQEQFLKLTVGLGLGFLYI